MKCPRSQDWDLLAMEALEGEPAESLLAHARHCPACREVYAAARREHVDRTRMYEAFDRGHDTLREQLLAALPADAPRRSALDPLVRGWYRLGDYTMTLSKTTGRRAAALLVPIAAALLIALLLIPPGQKSAFAAALERMRQANTIACRVQLYLNEVTEAVGTGKLRFSSEHGSRFDMSAGDPAAITTVYQPRNGPTRMVMGPPNRVVRLEPEAGPGQQFERETPDAFLQSILKLTGDADRRLGRRTVAGHEAEGFEVSGQKLRSSFGSELPGGPVESVARLWVDVQTSLPIRMEAEMTYGPSKSHARMVLDQFEWDVPLEAGLFEPPSSSALQVEPQTSREPQEPGAPLPPATQTARQETLVKALRAYADLHDGTYPSAFDSARMSESVALKLAQRAAAKSQKFDPMSREVLGKTLLMSQACASYAVLVAHGHQPEYFGGTVTAADKDKVLLRWQLGDGQVRVVYGDLRAETLPTEK